MRKAPRQPTQKLPAASSQSRPCLDPSNLPPALQGGYRRSIGQANRLADHLIRYPADIPAAWPCLTHTDPLIRMRAADALEKASRIHPQAFATHMQTLLDNTLDDGSPELRWHLIAITARLHITTRQAESFRTYLDHCLRNDPSRIVKVAALQAAHDLQPNHPTLIPRVDDMLRFAQVSPWPSVKARACKLQRQKAKRTP